MHDKIYITVILILLTLLIIIIFRIRSKRPIPEIKESTQQNTSEKEEGDSNMDEILNMTETTQPRTSGEFEYFKCETPPVLQCEPEPCEPEIAPAPQENPEQFECEAAPLTQDVENYYKSFAGYVTQTLCSSISSIEGFIEVITDETIPAKMIPLYYEAILSQTERLSCLTDEINAVSTESFEAVKLTSRKLS